MRGFPWRLYGHTDDGHQAIRACDDWCRKGYGARVLDRERRDPKGGGLYVLAELISRVTLCYNLERDEERPVQMEPEQAVAYLWRADHPGETAPAVQETSLGYYGGNRHAYKQDLTPAEVRRAMAALHPKEPA